MISNNLSQDVKNKLGITGKSELENLKFAKELTVEQNDRIAQTYNIEYSHNNKKRNWKRKNYFKERNRKIYPKDW